jgi:expansin (peptidoglycan-binding protein)
LNEDSEKIYSAALNQVQFDPYTVDGIPSTNPICQKKAIVKGAKGEIKVRFVDRCPDCKQGKYSFVVNNFNFDAFCLFVGDLGLTQEAFIAVAGELGTGQTNVEWHFI